jgi:ribosomal protein S8
MSIVKSIFNQNLRLKHCLKHFREFVTMFLRKINKSNYFVLKAYKFIALLNTLNKIMKSIMTIRLNYATKKYNLLFKKHFEDRKNIISKHVLHYIIETINSIWVNKKIALMLLLNVVEIFDNVFHSRLLLNLRKRQIKSIYLIWVKLFLSKRYIILKLIDHIINRICKIINVSQRSSMSSILYVFYNANLIDWCINSQIDITEADFIDDINILMMSDSIEKNVLSLKKIHAELCMIWAHEHDFLFVLIKYELIHFRRHFVSSNSKMIFRILDH